MDKTRIKEINERIEKINALLSEVSSLGWGIVNEFEDEYNINNYDWTQLPSMVEREICTTANNCGMIEGWNEFRFGGLRLLEKI